MASVAILCLLLLENFLVSDMDIINEPVLRGLRALEQTALSFTRGLPTDLFVKNKKLSKFYLFTEKTGDRGVQLRLDDTSGFTHFQPESETKIIIHGFLDKIQIATWMHVMKDELLMYDHQDNVIIVDWSLGNFIPYSQAAANTEKVGQEIANLLSLMMDSWGAQPEKFHLIGHSLGSHVAGYVGEKIKGLQRITGLDPATHLFSEASVRSRLDRNDAKFVDVIHTDGGGIGMEEPVGHVDFYPNGGEVQPGCTVSNSVRSLIEKGVVEGVRNIICSHMRAPLLFTDSINALHCQMYGYRCLSKEAFARGDCDSCDDTGCALMGFHVDTNIDYGNGTKFYLLTNKEAPFCGYEYKLTLSRLEDVPSRWSSQDVLEISLYGSSGSGEFRLEGKNREDFQANHVVLSKLDLGNIHGAVAHWSKKPLSRARSLVKAIIGGDMEHPLIDTIQVKPMKDVANGKNAGDTYLLCVNENLDVDDVQEVSTFRYEYC